ncbi:MAG TPA: response regulator [Geobacteraceae bacterium]
MDNDFQKRLLATFTVETREHLAAMSAGLIDLEKDQDPVKRQEILEAVCREAHSMKGAARAVNMAGIESLGHALESVFSGFKRGSGVPSPSLFDLLHRAIDAIESQLASPAPDQGAKVRELVRSLEKAAKGAPASAPPPPPFRAEQQPLPPVEKPLPSDTVRISAGKLDALLHQAEEMLTMKLAARQRAAELGEITAVLAAWEKEWKKVRPVLRMLDKSAHAAADRPAAGFDAGQVAKLLAFSEWSHTTVRSLEGSVHDLAEAVVRDGRSLDGMLDSLLDDLKGVLMLPCATVLEVLPRMVRDLARDRGKEAELTIVGETVELDKRVLEEIKDPLIHLVRNCVDHGIEKPAERERLNKPPRGRIAVTASLKDANRIELLIADDGAGMDTARLGEAAVRQGIVARDDVGLLRQEELQGLAFTPGLSTSPMITDISGRGLGLAIVREKVEKLGGTVTLASEPRQGTTFRMMLPLTMSAFRGVLVEAGEQTFIVPAAGVERVTRVAGSALKTVENRETVELDGTVVAFVRLADVLQIRRKGEGGGDGFIPLFVIGSGANRVAFGVDGIRGEQEVLVKGLGPQLSRVRNIAGATVLGSGRVATILHPGDLVKSAIRGIALPAVAALPAEGAEVPTRPVLVVEDSITARTLLKNILETAGYRTVTAVDGIDALTRLRTEQIDLVVSDVDMPRMNGFDLTAKIRSTRELADLPVVLVTSLDSREDRERGIEAGANAYIVKSSFDQSNLLDAIRRLI